MVSFSTIIGRLKRLKDGVWKNAGLSDLLTHADEKAELSERMTWLNELIGWLLVKGTPSELDARIRYLVQLLPEGSPRLVSFRRTLNSIFLDCSFLNFFLTTGYKPEHGFWSDLALRISNRIFPSSWNEDFVNIIAKSLHDEAMIERVANLPDSTLLKLDELIGQVEWKRQSPEGRVTVELREALLILSCNVLHHGLSHDMRGRLGKASLPSTSPFIKLGTSIHRLVLGLDAGEISDHDLILCRKDVDAVYLNMEKSGVSVASVHKLEMVSALLDQIEALSRLLRLSDQPRIEKVRGARDFIVSSARASLRASSMRDHISRHFYLLSRKVAERNGHSGEHYIAESSLERRSLFFSAMGGGLIVMAMTVCKTVFLRFELAPLFNATGVWVIYALGFLSMQACGFTLATKIPSFTAALLARKIKESRTRRKAFEFTDEVRLIGISQIIALFGNLASVIPLALLVDAFFRFAFHGHGLMSDHYAQHTISDLHPFKSMVVFFGALTGMELWASSICGGWFENWVVFRGIPEAIESHQRLKKVFGAKLAKKLANSFLQNASGIATNIALGFFFGFVPFFGSFFGLGLDGKHVTIATAGAAFAASAIRFHLTPQEWAWTALGLTLVGLMNFSVSFLMALGVAARAQEVRGKWIWSFLKSSFSSDLA